MLQKSELFRRVEKLLTQRLCERREERHERLEEESIINVSPRYLLYISFDTAIFCERVSRG